jgi:hypothetical protein
MNEKIITCPMTSQIYFNPVMTSDGHTYEKNAIVKWLFRHNTSPMTNIMLENNTLTKNIIVRQYVDEFINSNPEKISNVYNNDTYDDVMIEEIEEKKENIKNLKKQIDIIIEGPFSYEEELDVMNKKNKISQTIKNINKDIEELINIILEQDKCIKITKIEKRKTETEILQFIENMEKEDINVAVKNNYDLDSIMSKYVTIDESYDEMNFEYNKLLSLRRDRDRERKKN